MYHVLCYFVNESILNTYFLQYYSYSKTDKATKLMV